MSTRILKGARRDRKSDSNDVASCCDTVDKHSKCFN